MTKNCPYCGFANPQYASGCGNCQSTLRVASRRPEPTAVSKTPAFGRNQLIILLIVFVVATFAIYKMFDNSSVAKTDAKTSEANISNTALIDFSKEAAEIESNQNAQKRVQQAEYYRQKRERRKAASETPTDIFGSPEPFGCETYIDKDGRKIEKGKCL